MEPVNGMRVRLRQGDVSFDGSEQGYRTFLAGRVAKGSVGTVVMQGDEFHVEWDNVKPRPGTLFWLPMLERTLPSYIEPEWNGHEG